MTRSTGRSSSSQGSEFKTRVRANDGFDWSWNRSRRLTPNPGAGEEETVLRNNYNRRRSTNRHHRHHRHHRRSKSAPWILPNAVGTPVMVLGVMALVMMVTTPQESYTAQYVRALSVLSPSEESADGDFPPSLIEIVDSHTGTSSPAYRRVCQAVLEEDSSMKERTVVESTDLCYQVNDPSESLSSIYAAYFLSVMAKEHGLPITYEHSCGRTAIAAQRSVQQQLPSFEYEQEKPPKLQTLKRDGLDKLCLSVVTSESPRNLLRHTLPNRQTVFKTLQPVIQESLQAALETWLEGAKKQQKFQVQRVGDYYMESKHKEKNSARATSKEETNESYHANLLIPCSDVQCRDAVVVPFYEYALRIPTSTRSIHILVPEVCTERIAGCSTHAHALAEYLVSCYPRATVTLVPHHSAVGSMNVVGSLMAADYAVCGPGLESVCLYAMLGRRSQQLRLSSLYLPSRTIPNSTSSSLSGNWAPSDLEVVFHDNDAVLGAAESRHSQTATLLQLTAHSTPLSNVTLAELPSTSTGRQRRTLRGRMGRWVRDLSFAKRAQYKAPVRHLWGRADKKHRNLVNRGLAGDYREATTFAWEDTNAPLEPVTLERICKVLKHLQVGRIFFLGDSLSLNQALSLKQILGIVGKPQYDQYRASFQETVTCPSSTKHTFLVEVARNNHMLEMSEEEAKEYMSTPFQYGIQWAPRIKSNPTRTLLVINFGAHIETEDKFRSTFDHVMTQLDELEQDRNDIIMYRTSVPGHWGCEKSDSSVPHSSYHDYSVKREKYADSARKFRWETFETMNDYAVHEILKRQETAMSDKQGGEASMEILDVYPLTILRQDGHVGMDSNVEGIADCLHYSLPGPVDFWNHLMVSQLHDIAADEIKSLE